MTLIIAEAGVNHNGDEKLAFELVDAAFDSGADVVKFQTFKADNLASKYAVQAEYQLANTKKEESQLSMLRRLELPYETHLKLLDYCNKLGIEFLSTAFDDQSLDFLANSLKLKRLKIPSGELTNAPFILAHARTGCDLIISTGMATLSEIETALGVIAFGYLFSSDVQPSREAFQLAYFSPEGQQILKEKVILLHCTTEYPAPIDEINLNVIDTFKNAFGIKIGYSDHTIGYSIPVAAVVKGAMLIEKHFTLDKTMEGPDHKASLEPAELKAMVSAIREVEVALGTSIKIPTKSEIKNKPIARKSLVAAKPIRKGDIFTSDNLAIKRPGNGIEPINYWNLLGQKAHKSYEEDDLI